MVGEKKNDIENKCSDAVKATANVKIVNLTPHPVVIEGVGEIPPTSPPARCEEITERIGTVPGTDIPIIRKKFGKVVNLPEPQNDTIYIVSLPVAQAVRRADVLAIGEPIRNEKGQVIGAKSLASFVEE